METERLTLRRFTLEDAPKMYENWASDIEVTKYLMWRPHLKVETTMELLEDWVKGYDDKKRYDWCIELKENQEPIGSIGVIKVLEQAKLMEIGYCISKKYWHQGIASEAVQAVINFLFDEVGVNRVEARHDPRNLYSGKVMEHCGMYYEGTRIEADWNNSGICDEALYGLTQKQRKDLTVKVQKPNRTVISDETIEYVGILAKLELSSEEKENAKKDMGEMLDYIDKLNELDTTDIEPMSHVFPVNNVFREDIVMNSDDRENMLKNAPERKDGSYRVPKTIE